MGGIKDINFRPERDIPTLTDKVILVTGGEDLKATLVVIVQNANGDQRHSRTWK